MIHSYNVQSFAMIKFQKVESHTKQQHGTLFTKINSYQTRKNKISVPLHVLFLVHVLHYNKLYSITYKLLSISFHTKSSNHDDLYPNHHLQHRRSALRNLSFSPGSIPRHNANQKCLRRMAQGRIRGDLH